MKFGWTCWLSSAVFLLPLGLWWSQGARLGWTRTQRTHLEMDAITGIEYPVSVDGWDFGIELPLAGLLLALVILGMKRVFQTKPKTS
jgi:hypothetical protein